MQRLKSYLGMKQNIKEVTENDIDQDDAATKKPERNPLAIIERTREQFHADQKKFREDRIKSQLQIGFPLIPESRVLETKVGVDVPEANYDRSTMAPCFRCKVASVSGGYMASFYVVYIIHRDYSKALPFRRKNAYVQAGILSSLLFGLTTCHLFDIDVFGKWGRKFDEWVIKQEQNQEDTPEPVTVGGLSMTEKRE